MIGSSADRAARAGREGSTAEPTGVDRRQRRRAVKRANILAAAWELARRDGLAAISLRDLAERVDLRQPSLYVYFDSKLALYDAMFADGYRQLLDAVAARPVEDDARIEVARFLADLVRFSSDDVVRHQLLFQRTIPGFEPSPDAFALALEFYAVSVERLRAAGAEAQEDLDLFSALVSGLAHQQVANDPGGDRWVRQSGRTVDMFLADVDRRRHDRRRKRRTA